MNEKSCAPSDNTKTWDQIDWTRAKKKVRQEAASAYREGMEEREEVFFPTPTMTGPSNRGLVGA